MYKLMIKCFLVFFCLIGLFLSFGVYEKISCDQTSEAAIVLARKKIALLSPEERMALCAFFHTGISIDAYGHALIAQKPMSILCMSNPDNYQNPRVKLECHLVIKGYEIWKERKDWFPEKKFKFIEFPNIRDKTLPIIGLIHIELCKTNIQKHLVDFQQVLGEAFSSEEVFNILINPSHEKFHTLINNDFLQGILYGFGRNNAYLYEHNIRDRLVFFGATPYALNHYIRSSVELLSPAFVCDPTTDETKDLQKTYNYGCKLLYWTYFGRDFLETTLSFF